jgi:glutamate-ammonia-ligase adenylyltransferase
VSSLDAFSEYQLKQAWTWELQALTRARFVAGPTATAGRFNAIRSQALGRERDPQSLRTEMADMRQKMRLEQVSGQDLGPKYEAGGLIDIEFIVQLGVLENAASHPALITATETLEILARLVNLGWRSEEEGGVLDQTARALHQQRLLNTLVPGEDHRTAETVASAGIYQRILGRFEAESA